ncbi:MAG TPA: glucose-6-phosphate dehydrogenase, partial [Frankiaceae bacterium]|nr:glucose-6-phosphate dehydrogenase [Frankiaceae bacterium]
MPFVLRTGKALARDRREMVVHFRPVPHLPFPAHAGPPGNALRLQLDPDRLALGLALNGPGDPFVLEPHDLDVMLAPQDVPAHGRLLLDVLAGDDTLSIGAAEAEEC